MTKQLTLLLSRVINIFKALLTLAFFLYISSMFNVPTDYNTYAIVACWLCLCYLYYLSNDKQRNTLFVASLACVIIVPLIVVLNPPDPSLGILPFFGTETKALQKQHEMKFFMGVIAFMVLTAIPMYFYRNKKLPAST